MSILFKMFEKLFVRQEYSLRASLAGPIWPCHLFIHLPIYLFVCLSVHVCIIGVWDGGARGLQPPQHLRIFANLGKFGQGLRFFLGKFGQSLGYFWSFVLDFLGNYSIFFFWPRKVSNPTHKWPDTPKENIE